MHTEQLARPHAAGASSTSISTRRSTASRCPDAFDVDYNKRAEIDASNMRAEARQSAHPRADAGRLRHHRHQESGRQAFARASAFSTGSTSSSTARSAISACGLIDGPNVRIAGRVGWSCAENMMSGTILIEKNAGSQFGAAIRGGDLVCKGDVGSRTGIDMKGGTIIVGGDTGAFTGFMMQRGRMVICGNAGKNLGDSMYDGTIYIGGEPASLGVDAVWGEITDLDRGMARAQAQACTTCCRRAASGISARSSPASNCGTTTISSRPKRNWCCKRGRLGKQTMKQDARTARAAPRRRPRRSASSWARARSSRRRSSTTSM